MRPPTSHECCTYIHHGQADGVDKLDDPFSVVSHKTVTRDNERLGALCTRARKACSNLFRVVHVQGLDAHTQQAGGGFDCCEIRHARGAVPRRREVADPRDVWERLFQEFQAFASELLRDVDDAGDIASRCARLVMSPRRTGSSLALIMTIGMVLVACLATRVASVPPTTRQSTWRPDQLGDQRRKTLGLAVRKARLDDEILAFRITQFPEALGECSLSDALAEAVATLTTPIRYTFADGCAWAASGAVRRTRASITTKPNGFAPHGYLLLWRGTLKRHTDRSRLSDAA